MAIKLCYDGSIPKPTKQKHATKQKHRKRTNCRNKKKCQLCLHCQQNINKSETNVLVLSFCVKFALFFRVNLFFSNTHNDSVGRNKNKTETFWSLPTRDMTIINC